MTENDPELYISAESTETSFFGQNRLKPVISVKHQFFQSKSTKTTLFGQNRPKPLFSVKTDLPAKINEDQFFGQNRPKPAFSVKTQFLRPKSTKTTFLGLNRPKQVFFGPNPLRPLLWVWNNFFGQNEPTPFKIDSKLFFLVKTQFLQSKSTKTGVFGQHRSKPVFWSKPRFFSQKQRKPPFSAKIGQNQFFRSTSTKTIQNPPPFSSVLIPSLD